MSNDNSTRKVQATEHTSNWKSDPIYIGSYSLYGDLAEGGQYPLPRTSRTPGGRTDGPPVVYSDQGTIRAHPELVLARLLERERELTDIRDSLRVCEEGLARLLSERQAEHLSRTESELSDLRERSSQLDTIPLQGPFTGWTSTTDGPATHWGASCFGDGWAYNPRSGGSDQ